MDLLVMIVLLMFQSCASAFFIVELEKERYYSKFSDMVQMGCKFQPIPKDPLKTIQLSWHRIAPGVEREVYRMEKGKEHFQPVNSHFGGRVKLPLPQLNEGWTKLELSDLRINDSGVYQCLVQYDIFTDYKEILLFVTAPFTNVTKWINLSRDEQLVNLTCESEGYPATSVTWTDVQHRPVHSSTFTEKTPEHLIRLVSHIVVNSSQANNYTCRFEKGVSSATFTIPDDLQTDQGKDNMGVRTRFVGFVATLAVLFVASLVLLAFIGVAVYLRHKGRKSLAGTDSERLTLTEDLRTKLKSSYSKWFQDWIPVQDIRQRIRNREGQTVPLSSILPETEETVLVETPPGSEKKSLAHMLMRSWVSDSMDDHQDIDLSNVHLLLYVDASETEEDLLDTIKSRHPVEVTLKRDELRRVMTSNTCLLVLDGYKEGISTLDDSLMTFVKEMGKCSLLVMSFMDQCPDFKQKIVKSENMLTLEKL